MGCKGGGKDYIGGNRPYFGKDVILINMLFDLVQIKQVADKVGGLWGKRCAFRLLYQTVHVF